MNLHFYIKQEFGSDCLHLVRELEKTSLKIARFTNHVRFNLTCFNQRVTPKYLCLPTPEVKGQRVINIIKRAERSLLNERIRQTNFTLDCLKDKYHQIETKLRGKIPDVVYDDVSEFVTRANRKEHDAVKSRQIRKYRCLTAERENRKKLDIEGVKSDSDYRNKWVVNLSTRTLDNSEVSALQHGLNFAVSPDYVPVKDVIIATELACKNIANDKAAELRARVVNIVKTSKPPTSNVTQNERTAIENLSKDKNIKILPADKGRATVYY